MNTDPVIPETVPLHRVAKALGKSTHVLVCASSQGQFPPIVRVGSMWFVQVALLREWFDRQHAPAAATPGQLSRIRAAALELDPPDYAARGCRRARR